MNTITPFSLSGAALGLLLVSAAPLGAQPGAAAAARTPPFVLGQETAGQRALSTMVAKKIGWRRAVPADNTKLPELRRAGVPAPEQPYFAAETPGVDGSFAFALIKTDTFRVYYSRWANGRYSSPQEVGAVTWLNRGQLIVRGDTLEIAPLASDEIFSYVWNGARHAMLLKPRK